MQWQIVIPMSGFGERFRKAGYTRPKPLIEVDGKPIIAHVLDLFPGEVDVHCICNSEHLANDSWDMKGILHHYCPTVTVHSIAPHKRGPVHTVASIMDALDPERPVAVNYCDFTGQWDWAGFKKFMQNTRCDGAVICYTGFHPHMLACTRFAYCKTDGTDRVLAIQEKQPYTDTPMQEWASCGTYCFASGALLRQAYSSTLSRDDLLLNGEYYSSLAYRPLLERGCNIRVFPMDAFCQWGTPEDLADWRTQTHAVRLGGRPQARPDVAGTTLIPMAGMGSRFADAGYATPKPLIEVNGTPMALAAWADLPRTPANVFALRKDMPGASDIAKRLEAEIPATKLVWLDAPTDGQARTCLLALPAVADKDAPLTVGACDNGLRYNAKAFEMLWAEQKPDVVVWTMRGHSGAVRHPEYYGWVDADAQGNVRRVSVKKPLAAPATDPIITGAFTFRTAQIFEQAAQRMIERNRLVNGEFYVDECINDAIDLGFTVRLFDVDAYLCWGTPDDLQTWEYWARYLRRAHE
ncbi:hypothetical protein DDIC_00935 [Desulfovibrio desulfuricans]|uniref:Nucleotidyl transferase domain-containing protein n=1 Tax=Desulfovibrio desulfuricans TaxID=876 RepID=A0A4P7UF22_DESDE|nr:sugar phosphate nucleotidyltransferase [Desulfovibrio desulfuricans]QCC84465.1 hypothetical protein DDIC_00935 [Desulfovibrio desulfuricans]